MTALGPLLMVKQDVLEELLKREAEMKHGCGENSLCDCGPEEAPASGYIEKVQRLRADLCDANGYLVEIVGPPKSKQDSVGKEPGCLGQALSFQLWLAQEEVLILIEQLKRLRGQF